MKTIILLIIIAFSLFLVTKLPETPRTSDKELCIAKGGVPIMNWNETQLKDCKFNDKTN